MPKKRNTIKAGRCPIKLVNEPGVTLAVLQTFVAMDYLHNAGVKKVSAAQVMELTGLAEDELKSAVDYLIEYDWIQPDKEKPASIRLV